MGYFAMWRVKCISLSEVSEILAGCKRIEKESLRRACWELQQRFSTLRVDSTLSATAQPFQPQVAPQSSREDDAPRSLPVQRGLAGSSPTPGFAPDSPMRRAFPSHHQERHTRKREALEGLIKVHGEVDKADKSARKSLKKEIDQRHKGLEMLKERISHYEAQLEQEPSEGSTPSDDSQICHGAQAEAAPVLAADDAPSESATTPLTPASDPSPAEDQAQDMEVDDYAVCPSLPSPVSHEDDELLSGLPQSEATEVESGLAHLTVSSPRGLNGEGEEASL